MSIGQARGERGVRRGDFNHHQAGAGDGPDFQHRLIAHGELGAQGGRFLEIGRSRLARRQIDDRSLELLPKAGHQSFFALLSGLTAAESRMLLERFVTDDALGQVAALQNFILGFVEFLVVIDGVAEGVLEFQNLRRFALDQQGRLRRVQRSARESVERGADKGHQSAGQYQPAVTFADQPIVAQGMDLILDNGKLADLDGRRFRPHRAPDEIRRGLVCRFHYFMIGMLAPTPTLMMAVKNR